jgi:CRISPR-associated protein Csm4
VRTFQLFIRPLSAFGTSIKGDTLFGLFCWTIKNDPELIGYALDTLIEEYASHPYLIVSSAFPVMKTEGGTTYFFKKPSLPISCFLEDKISGCEKIQQRKRFKKQIWMPVDEKAPLHSFKGREYYDDEKAADVLFSKASRNRSFFLKSQYLHLHNSINRLTNATGEEGFAPFAVNNTMYHPSSMLVIFIAIDTKISPEKVQMAFERIGLLGFGRDASTGLGRFEVCGSIEEINLSALGAQSPNACYTLSPVVPEKKRYRGVYTSPFVRFGKHGDTFAKSLNPFKNPVLMADEGAVAVPKNTEVFNKNWIGEAVKNLSKTEPCTIAQGYSLYIPVYLEGV